MAERPVPQPTLLTEQYWKGGADGELRMCSCVRCDALIHPPAPACRWCGGTETGTTVVSGYGTVVGVTVNWHQWDPAFEPPYVVATVALDEDPRGRIVTNLVDLEPDDAVVGMRVGVRFVPSGDVWLPVFAPMAEPSVTELPPDDLGLDDHHRLIRPMLRTHKFEDDVVISGIGMSAIGRRLMRRSALARRRGRDPAPSPTPG